MSKYHILVRLEGTSDWICLDLDCDFTTTADKLEKIGYSTNHEMVYAKEEDFV